MPKTHIKGNTSESNFTVGIVVARWNSFVTDQLLQGATEVFQSKGLKDEQIVTVSCPGAYEIPLTAQKLLPRVDGIVVLGAVIRGDTPHFDYVCDAVNRGVLDLNLRYDKPVTFGVLTTDNVEQATLRSGLEEGMGNKGAEAALALLEMLSLVRQIDEI